MVYFGASFLGNAVSLIVVCTLQALVQKFYTVQSTYALCLHKFFSSALGFVQISRGYTV